jgi:DNA-binding NtrC family response regulator
MSVLELAEQALRDAGHRVLATWQPAELLQLARHVWIDVVVADRRLLDDVGLVEELHSIQPHLRVVQAVGARSELPPGDDNGGLMLTAPFTLAHVQKVVQTALNTRPSA